MLLLMSVLVLPALLLVPLSKEEAEGGALEKKEMTGGMSTRQERREARKVYSWQRGEERDGGRRG